MSNQTETAFLFLEVTVQNKNFSKLKKNSFEKKIYKLYIEMK